MTSPLIRSASLLCLSVALLVGVSAQLALAEPIFIGGAGIMQAHPTLSNEGFELASPSSSATIANEPEADIGLVSALSVRVDLTSYTTVADPLILEPATFTIAGGDIVLTFGPASFTQLMPPNGIIGSGDIKAPIVGASTTVAGLSVDQFIGGSFQMTFTGALISAGTGASGGGSILFDLVPTASFTISTPEPASVVLAVMSGLGALGLCFRLRRAS